MTTLRAAAFRRALLFLPVAAAVVLAAGCGGGGSSASSTQATDPTEWANSLCGSIDTWASSIRSAASTLQGGNVTRASLQDTANKVKDATNTLADDMKSMGKPNTQAGQKAKQQLDTLSDKYKSEVQSMENTVKNASGASGTLSAVSKVSSTLVTMGSQLQAAFADLQKLDAKGELDKAFRSASNCKKLRRQGA